MPDQGMATEFTWVSSAVPAVRQIVEWEGSRIGLQEAVLAEPYPYPVATACILGATCSCPDQVYLTSQNIGMYLVASSGLQCKQYCHIY